jgi:hypothetical protein
VLPCGAALRYYLGKAQAFQGIAAAAAAVAASMPPM